MRWQSGSEASCPSAKFALLPGVSLHLRSRVVGAAAGPSESGAGSDAAGWSAQVAAALVEPFLQVASPSSLLSNPPSPRAPVGLMVAFLQMGALHHSMLLHLLPSFQAPFW